MDEEEVAMVSEEDSLNTTITNVENAKLAPKDGRHLNVEFEVENYEELEEKYPDETQFIMALVYDKDNNCVFTKMVETDGNSGTFTWNGIYETEQGKQDTINSENAPYKLFIKGYCGNDPSSVEDLSCDYLGDNACLIKNLILHTQSTLETLKSAFGDSVLFVSDEDTTEIGVNNEWEEWTGFEDKEDYALCDYDRYREIRDHYLDRMDEIGVDTSKTDPIEYLNKHLVSGEFLEMEIPSINIRFLYLLRKLEVALGRGESGNTQYKQFCQQLEQNGSEISSYARMSTVGKGENETLSDHGLGYAIDIDASKNIYVSAGKLADYIEFLTNKDLVYNNLSMEESKTAHNRFMDRKVSGASEFKGLFTTNLIQQYFYLKELDEDTITTYLKNLKDQMKTKTQNIIDSLEAGDDLDSLQQSFQENMNYYKTEYLEIFRELNNIQDKIDSVDNVIYLEEALQEEGQLSGFESYFSENRNTISEITDLIDYQLDELDSGNSDQWKSNLVFFVSDLRDISFGDYSTELSNFEDMMNEKFNLILDDLTIENLEISVSKLKEKFDVRIVELYSYLESIDDVAFGAQIMENGIFTLPVNFVRPLIDTEIGEGNMKLYWGGHYSRIKDYMHFEIRPRSNQELLEQMDKDDIVNYLNEFEDEDRY
jgi:hypothetical protein